MEGGGGGGASETQITEDEVFRDFMGRRAAIVKALTTDVEEFFRQCDPKQDNLCLYGLPNEQWHVSVPDAQAELPSLLPLPSSSISSAAAIGDRIDQYDWLFYIAANCDTWLLSVVSYNATGFTEDQRIHLYDMMVDIHTVHDVVSRWLKKEGGVAASEEEEHCICGDAGEKYEFWICCDFCETWYHGKCVMITAEEAKHIKKYKCPSCRCKAQRLWQYCMKGLKGATSSRHGAQLLPRGVAKTT